MAKGIALAKAKIQIIKIELKYIPLFSESSVLVGLHIALYLSIVNIMSVKIDIFDDLF